MANPENGDKPIEPASAGTQVRNASRRRVLRGAAASAPVVLTLVSRPVLGWQCLNASTVASAGSQSHAVATYCSGRTPEFWSNPSNFDKWPAPYVATAAATPTPGTVASVTAQKTDAVATPFHCATTGFSGNQNGNKTLVAALKRGGPGTNQSELSAYLGAALLNARAGLTPVLDEFGVRRIWNEYIGTGYYQPTPGVQWYAHDIIAWLKTTMPV